MDVQQHRPRPVVHLGIAVTQIGLAGPQGFHLRAR